VPALAACDRPGRPGQDPGLRPRGGNGAPGASAARRTRLALLRRCGGLRARHELPGDRGADLVPTPRRSTDLALPGPPAARGVGGVRDLGGEAFPLATRAL